jgi:PTH1 family peptidyl-tRNA hydrolase
VISLLGTDAFLRLRIGIDRPDSKDKRVISDYVLEDFTKEEMDVLRKTVFPKALGMLIERGILE